MKKYLFTLLLLLILPITVFANDGKFISQFDENIEINESVSGSAVFGANNVTIDSSIDGVGLIMGNIVKYNAVSEYGIILGNTIEINGTLRDGLILGNIITFSKDSNIERDTAILGNEITISGNFYRDTYIDASKVIIEDIQILGNIKINAESIVIKENAKISGTLSYNDNAEIEIDDTAIIESTSTYKGTTIEDITFVSKLKNFAIKLINVLVIFAISLFIIPKFYQSIINKKDYLKSIGIGLITIIVFPIIAMILIMTILGLSLGFILLGLYVLLFMISHIVTGYVIGNCIWKKYIKVKERPYLIGLMGITIILLLTKIPYIGGLISFISFMFAFGTIILLFKKKK